MFVDDMQKISDEEAIGELPIGGLSRYRRVYDKKIFDPFDGCYDSFADDTCNATREKTAQRFTMMMSVFFVVTH